MDTPKTEPKHIACARCRDRKVKCDGAKPSCRRCVKNRASCQYVRSSKKQQQGKGEWTQHLRTFSFQPDKASSSPRPTSQSQSPPQPYISHPSHRSCFQSSSTASYPRTPSPYYLDSDHSVLVPFPTPNWTGDTYTPSLDPSSDSLDPSSLPLNPSLSFCAPGYAPDFGSPSTQTLMPLGTQPMRSYTPMSSQASEGTSASFDGVMDTPYAYSNTNYFTPPPNTTDWEPHNFTSTTYSTQNVYPPSTA
ncbi:hypothetical protein P280DRAFT_92237 [Massarina eburnea CBS 473.64]|uniref:Zn(2)-C6 fungal-type domain-containing protein n=1 Tax=Massarina eburnea CBS 473.64 TaxID=1395130 RepID=A0A6A6RV50_9PLEO|nr:hypothetical protein P280DRAFT_92237 [Massarina eburnea CBS 473.64]